MSIAIGYIDNFRKYKNTLRIHCKNIPRTNEGNPSKPFQAQNLIVKRTHLTVQLNLI